MLFDLGNPFDVDKYKEYVNTLYKQKAVVEVTRKFPKRSLKQNSYLHLILAYFASQYGCTEVEAKQDYFKRLCNKDLFVRSKVNKFGVTIETVRSSADLSTSEMTTAIERFRNWAAQLPLYIPSPNDSESMITYCLQEIDRNKEYI